MIGVDTTQIYKYICLLFQTVRITCDLPVNDVLHGDWLEVVDWGV